MQELLEKYESEMDNLRKTVTEKDEESRKRQSLLDAKLQELEHIKSISGKYTTILLCKSECVCAWEGVCACISERKRGESMFVHAYACIPTCRCFSLCFHVSRFRQQRTHILLT